MKINNYFKIYFPLCCGILDLRDINYAKSPYIFCFDCNLLICNKCFLKHRNHKYFDIINSYKKKFANIHSNKNKFLNADPSKLKNIVDEYAEDLILKFIIYNLKSNINSKLKDVKNKDEVNITILDFLDIIIYDLLIKNIFPYALNQDDFKILKKKYIKTKEQMINKNGKEEENQQKLKLAFENSKKIDEEFDGILSEKDEHLIKIENLFPELDLNIEATENLETFQKDYIMNCKEDFNQVLKFFTYYRTFRYI